jgi:hypothetical protein
MTKIAGSGSASGSESGSISQRHGSADPDPDPDPPQNVMGPQHWALPMMVSTSMEMKRSLPSTSLCSGASSVSSLRSGGGSGHWFSLLAAVASKQPEERREFMMEPTCCCCCCCWLNTVPCDPQRMSIICRRQSKNFCVFKACSFSGILPQFCATYPVLSYCTMYIREQ